MPRGVKKGLDTKKFNRCVTKVKHKSGKKVNPYAVCNASMSGKTRRQENRHKLKICSYLKNINSIFFHSTCILSERMTQKIQATNMIHNTIACINELQNRRSNL